MTNSTSTAGSKRPSRSDESERAAAAEPVAPSPELLEFLGEFEAEGGEWIDPLDLDGALDAPAPRDGGGDD